MFFIAYLLALFLCLSCSFVFFKIFRRSEDQIIMCDIPWPILVLGFVPYVNIAVAITATIAMLIAMTQSNAVIWKRKK
jgi:hypothetical protein